MDLDIGEHVYEWCKDGWYLIFVYQYPTCEDKYNNLCYVHLFAETKQVC